MQKYYHPNSQECAASASVDYVIGRRFKYEHSLTVAHIFVTPGEICSKMAKSSWLVFSCILLPIALSTLSPSLKVLGQFIGIPLESRWEVLLHLRRDLAIHQKGTMCSLSYIWLYSMDKSAASNFGCASDHGNRDLLNEALKPSNIVSEDVALASTGCEIIDDNVGFFGHWALCSDATNRIE